MDDNRPTRAPGLPPAQLAKAALRRLALSKQEPTPENYAAAYASEAGGPVPAAAGEGLPERAQGVLSKLTALAVGDLQTRTEIGAMLRENRWDDALRRLEKVQGNVAAQAEATASTLERLVRGLERGGRQWTVARKKDGLQRVLQSNRSDSQRLLARLQQLVQSWDGDVADAAISVDESPAEEGGTPTQFFTDSEFAADLESKAAALPDASAGPAASATPAWREISASLQGTVGHALHNPQSEQAPEGMVAELLAELQSAQQELATRSADEARAQAMDALCQRARLLLDHRHHLFGELGQLCRELSASLVDLAEDDSWARGQCEAMNQTLETGLSARGVRSVAEVLGNTRERQRNLREERSRARDSLKSLIHKMLAELGELGAHTDRFQDSVGRYAEVIEKADSLESLAGVVREMVEESRSVQALVRQTQQRLSSEHDRASQLSERVGELEKELRRLSDEVHTDQLTQIANRRGLIAAFGIEQAKQEREGTQLALALLDIDNFKKLNDTLGHAAGDEALKSLAARVAQLLRPGDMVARYGGEEFVLMLPTTPLDEAQAVLTRLQRSLSAALFMHEGKDVFVTFSAGITLYRPGETLEVALDRADVALYEAKHTGKNRACVAP